MVGLSSDHGMSVVSDPAQAEVIIVNTCGFIEAAKEESIDAILEMAEFKTKGVNVTADCRDTDISTTRRINSLQCLGVSDGSRQTANCNCSDEFFHLSILRERDREV